MSSLTSPSPDKVQFITLKGVRTNNLKNIDVQIPLKKLTAITGLSGSGKSSLAFDTLYAEGQRRYVESLSTYTRQFLDKMPRPDIDGIDHVSPALALEQKNHINNSRSTVATMSEIYDYLRLFFARLGNTFCLTCQRKIRKDTPQTVAEDCSHDDADARYYILAPLADPPKKGLQAWWQGIRQELLGRGFQRILHLQEESGHFELMELPEHESHPKGAKGLFFLVLDRLGKPEHPLEDPRFLEAVQSAFIEGNGTMAVGLWARNKEGEGVLSLRRFSDRFRCDTCQKDYPSQEPHLLSFNSPAGACPNCSGFGHTLEVSENLVVPDPLKTLRQGAIDPFDKPASTAWQKWMMEGLQQKGINPAKRYQDLTAEEKQFIWHGFTEGTKASRKKLYPGVHGFFEDLKSYKYKMHVRIFIRRYQDATLCQICDGKRLRPEAMAVRFRDKNIVDILEMPMVDARRWFDHIAFTPHEKAVGRDIIPQVQGRLGFLDDVGVGYLPLHRLSRTLSGGECQRIHLASQLGNKLCSTLYVLDEPSIGLHPADTHRMIRLLHQLRDHGNTVVVVEHDLDVLKAADTLIELGPGAGRHGGSLVATGTPQELAANPKSLTGPYLAKPFASLVGPGKKHRPIDKTENSGKQKWLRLQGATENNLKNVDVRIPLEKLIVVTGLSGSGKTTLIHKTLFCALDRLFHRTPHQVGRYSRIYGTDALKDVVLLDQKPIGRSSRSNPATYLKFYDEIRKIFASQALAARRGFDTKHFSFNVDGGRCPVCKGEGEVAIDMHFLAEVKLPCEECEGKRFQKSVLEVEFKKKNIFQILNTSVDECYELFQGYQSLQQRLDILRRVGLGYIQIGQAATTLSGGESQRLKIAGVLSERANSGVLYIFDEPTTGLHAEDVKRLISVLQELVDHGNTVLVIEHNVELMTQADHIIDLGPGGGQAGGEIVAEGTPDEIMQCTASLTGRHLRMALGD